MLETAFDIVAAGFDIVAAGSETVELDTIAQYLILFQLEPEPDTAAAVVGSGPDKAAKKGMAATVVGSDTGFEMTVGLDKAG